MQEVKYKQNYKKDEPVAINPLKVPPHDINAEQALLGSIFIRPDGLNEVIEQVKSTDFYSYKHRTIFEGILALFEKNEPVDVVSVSSWLKDQKLIEKAGGASYMAELINSVPSATNIQHYADIITKKSSLRRLIESAHSILELGYNEVHDTDDVFDQAEKIIFGISNFTKKKFTMIKDTLTDAWERFDKLHKSTNEMRGVPTGFPDLDNLLAGFQKSDLIILAARPSVGKTSFALDIARNVACRHNVPTAIFSLEMSTQQLVDRIIAAESRVDSWQLRTGRLSKDEEFERIRDALDTLSKAPIFIDDEPSNNITKIRSVARRLKNEHNLGLIIIDYLQLMTPKRDVESLVQQVTEISRSLKGLARELDVPVIALSQLSRAVEQRGGRPRLSDLRDSGSIEQDADVVMFIHREDKNNANNPDTAKTGIA
ncbi:MAG: replicative DNA helicase, partial [bacterium]